MLVVFSTILIVEWIFLVGLQVKVTNRWLDGITDSMDKNPGKLPDSEGQGSLACCSPWGHEESDTTWWLNNNWRILRFFKCLLLIIKLKGFLVAQKVKNLPAIQETRVRSLGWKDPLEKGVATHSSTLAWSIPWTEEPGGLQSMETQRVGTQLSD